MSERRKMVREHPLPDALRAEVLKALAAIEREEDVRVLYACESGSRGWGFASPDSDYDVRFVYVRRLDRYLTANPTRDVIERPIDAELDLGGWDLRKTLQLLLASNPTLLEWLRSPLVYREDEAFTRRLRELALERFSLVRGYHHYVSMAKKNLHEHLQGETVRLKKYFYVLRSLLAARWIREFGSPPPMVFADLVEATLHEPDVRDELDALLAVKMRSGEALAGARWPGLHAYIEREMAAAREQAVPETRPRLAERVADALLHETVLRFGAAP